MPIIAFLYLELSCPWIMETDMVPEHSSDHYTDVIMGAVASQITSLTIVCSIVYSGAVQRKHQSSALLAFVRGLHQWPVNSLHKWPVTWKMFPFDDVIVYKEFRGKCQPCTSSLDIVCKITPLWQWVYAFDTDSTSAVYKSICFE